MLLNSSTTNATAKIKAKLSATGPAHNAPSTPHIAAKIKISGIKNTNCLDKDKMDDFSGLPTDCINTPAIFVKAIKTTHIR